MSFTAGPNGFGLDRWNGSGFDSFPGILMRICQHPTSGSLAGVNVRGEIFVSDKGDGSDWRQLPGLAVDLCWGPSGLIVVGTAPG